eukprot:m.345861 g.345861  ORF g.345861 m.345861 type:complete len:85 (-) comp19860_c0_seq7:2286-2540(-)
MGLPVAVSLVAALDISCAITLFFCIGIGSEHSFLHTEAEFSWDDGVLDLLVVSAFRVSIFAGLIYWLVDAGIQCGQDSVGFDGQ